MSAGESFLSLLLFFKCSPLLVIDLSRVLSLGDYGREEIQIAKLYAMIFFLVLGC